MFQNLLSKVTTLLQSGNKNEAIEQLQSALNDALADNSISPQELDEVLKLQKSLGISDADMADVKLKVLNNLAEKINADGKVAEDEMTMFNTIKSSLGVEIPSELQLHEDDLLSKANFLKSVEFMKKVLHKVKDESVSLGGSIINKAKDLLKDKEDKPVK
jgi:hypothetical protein